MFAKIVIDIQMFAKTVIDILMLMLGISKPEFCRQEVWCGGRGRQESAGKELCGHRYHTIRAGISYTLEYRTIRAGISYNKSWNIVQPGISYNKAGISYTLGYQTSWVDITHPSQDIMQSPRNIRHLDPVWGSSKDVIPPHHECPTTACHKKPTIPGPYLEYKRYHDF